MSKGLVGLPFKKACTWLTFSLCLLIVSLGIAWKISVALNLHYSTWYDVLNISSFVQKYGVQNNFNKHSIIHTDKNEQVLLFEKILSSVTNDGEGLDQISFNDDVNRKILLLTESEIIHLNDVSLLINKLSYAWGSCFLLFVSFCCYFYFRQITFPDFKDKVVILSGVVVSIVLLFGIYGFTDIFYYLHTLVFPEGHQWFFYYQDSLMSTLMKAPDLFAAIGAMLLFYGGVVHLIIWLMLQRFGVLPR